MANEVLDFLEDIKKKGQLRGEPKVNDTVLLVDGLNFFIRCHSCFPTLNDDGDHVGGISGFLTSLGTVIRKFSPTRCIIIFDGNGGSQRRRKIYEDYKKHRRNKTKIRLNRKYDFKDINEEKADQIKQLIRTAQYLDNLPVTIMSIDRVEADDVISYIATEKLTSDNNQSTIIVSSDKDFLQLIDDRVQVYNPIQKVLYNQVLVADKFKVPVHNFLLYRILDGDESDNINGIRGIGLKTLQKRFPIMFEGKISIDDLVSYAEQHKDESKIYRDVVTGRNILDRNRKLMQLHNVDIAATTKLKISNLFDLYTHGLNRHQFYALFTEDKLWCSIKDVYKWLQLTFGKLNSFARNEEK